LLFCHIRMRIQSLDCIYCEYLDHTINKRCFFPTPPGCAESVRIPEAGH
jgi:hypothetical protein